MPRTAPTRRLTRNGMGVVLAAGALLAGTAAAAAPAPRDEAPRQFHLAAQTASASIWAERCTPVFRARGRSAVRAARHDWTLPRPDPDDLSALMAALRRSDFETSGVRVVETGDGPMLKLAGRRPGAPDTYFMLCNAAIHTAYE